MLAAARDPSTAELFLGVWEAASCGSERTATRTDLTCKVADLDTDGVNGEVFSGTFGLRGATRHAGGFFGNLQVGALTSPGIRRGGPGASVL